MGVPTASIDQMLQTAGAQIAAGQMAQAERTLRHILASDPANPHAIQLLGVVEWRVGKVADGLALMERSIELNPGEHGYHFNKGLLLRECGKHAEAAAAFLTVLRLNPNQADAQEWLGHCLQAAGRIPDAAEAFYRLVQLRPDHAPAYMLLASALYEIGRAADAAATFRELLRRHPTDADAMIGLTVVLTHLGQTDEAIDMCKRAMATRPNFPEAYNSLGILLTNQGRLQQAVEALNQAIRLRPDFMFPHNNLGNALTELQRLDEAIAAYGRAQQLQPSACDPHYNQGWAYMLKGDFERGWPKMEWRFGSINQPHQLNDYGRPRWDGRELHGRTILLQTEQGLGDVIHFIRYAARVAGRGGRVLLNCRPELVRLCKGVAGVADAVSGEVLPQFDVQIPLMSLPLVFKTTLDSILADIPYIHPDPAASKQWAQHLDVYGSAPRIALAWAGSPDNKQDAKRSMTLREMAPLADILGVIFVSLQKGAAAAQAAEAPAGMTLLDFTADLNDFADTAALLDNVDLLICVDTAVAHLAGAMGKPAWALLPFKPDWRWMVRRDDSPWYPTLRLFRQEQPGQWAPAVERVAQELRAFIASARSAPKALKNNK